jgi:hypothetical protein
MRCSGRAPARWRLAADLSVSRMNDTHASIDRAVRDLGVRRTFRQGPHNIVIAALVREADWRPLQAPWWRGKEVCVIGADIDGNFFLRHCDGSVRHWQHALQADIVLTRSVAEFIRNIDF